MTQLTDRPAGLVRDPEDLFEEARRRRRRRRLRRLLGVAVGLAAVLVGVAIAPTDTARTPPEATIRPPATRTTPLKAVPSEIAWVDYSDRLHMGDMATGRQRVVARAVADPTTPLVSLDGWIWWIRSTPEVGGQPVPGTSSQPGAVGFDPATGRKVLIPDATQVFPSLDRRFLYVVLRRPATDRTGHDGSTAEGPILAEYSPAGTSLRRRRTFPPGWYSSAPSLLGDPSPATANGVLVRSEPEQVGTVPPRLGIWDLATQGVRDLGPVWQVDATYTSHGAHSSVVAWLPGRCEMPRVGPCPLLITDTGTLVTRSIGSPLGNGFDWGGAFSPGGRELAVFLTKPSGPDGPETQLALITMSSGKLRAVPGALVNTGDAVAWAQWLSGSELLAGGTSGRTANDIPPANRYLVNARSLTLTTFSFLADGNQDVNLSAVFVAPST